MSDEALADDIGGEARKAVRARRRSVAGETKWGGAVTGGENGYQFVPEVLLRKQDVLKLDATDIVVLLNMGMH